MEKKKLTLKKEVVATLSHENLRGGVDVIEDNKTKYLNCIETGICVDPPTNQKNCYSEVVICLQTKVCPNSILRCDVSEVICEAKTVKCLELGEI